MYEVFVILDFLFFFFLLSYTYSKFKNTLFDIAIFHSHIETRQIDDLYFFDKNLNLFWDWGAIAPLVSTYATPILTRYINSCRIIIPGNQRHGDGEDCHVLAAQQIVADRVLLAFHAPVVQADDHGQAEHNGELGHQAQLFHGDVGGCPRFTIARGRLLDGGAAECTRQRRRESLLVPVDIRSRDRSNVAARIKRYADDVLFISELAHHLWRSTSRTRVCGNAYKV